MLTSTWMCLMKAFHNSTMDRTPPQTPRSGKTLKWLDYLPGLILQSLWQERIMHYGSLVYIRSRKYDPPRCRGQNKHVMRLIPAKYLQHSVAVGDPTKFIIFSKKSVCLRKKAKIVSLDLTQLHGEIFRAWSLRSPSDSMRSGLMT